MVWDGMTCVGTQCVWFARVFCCVVESVCII